MSRIALVGIIASAFALGSAGCDSGQTTVGGDGSVNTADANKWPYDAAYPYDGWYTSEAPPFEECADYTETADNSYGPVDIIFTIDNSKSMYDEIEEVRANMNRFSQIISDRNLDARIILISCLPGECENTNSHGICIDAPLGKTDGCTTTPPADNNPPAYTHISDRVPSVKGMEWTLEHYDDYKDVLRPEARKHVVFVSDDTDETAAADFLTALQAKDASFADVIVHGIYAFSSKVDACAISESEPCCEFAAPDFTGESAYKSLIEQTGGVSADLCLQEFDGVFDAFAGSVIANAKLNCEWSLPLPPADETLDLTKINVIFVDGNGTGTLIGKVESSADCGGVEQAWYYDDATNPTKVLVCPQTCTWIQGDSEARIDVKVGCRTEVAPVL
ncbi:MAG: VWA domain-containing protein [Deltaproteobacteria bacterium]|nr:VWA domain-containing protein [Deltaproteobacteria bacterium]